MNTRQPAAERDLRLAEGEAALMLLESLILALVEHEILTADQVKEAIEIVIETRQVSPGDTESPPTARAAIRLLNHMMASVSAASSPASFPPS